MRENLPHQLEWPLPAGIKLTFHVTTLYYQQLFQVENDELGRVDNYKSKIMADAN